MENRGSQINPFVSVIVVTLAIKKAQLLSCLQSLRFQTYRQFETVVVVSKERATTVSKIVEQSGLTSVRIILEEKSSGVSKARNDGIRNSISELLMFLDDDAIANSSWIENLVKYGLGNKAVAVTGKVIPFSKKIDPLIAFLGSTYDQGNQVKLTDRIIGCNMGFNKKIFSSIGFFDNTIDYGGDEVELASRLLLANYKILYIPQAVVRHDLADNFTMLIKQSFKEGKHSTKYERVFVKQKPWEKIETLLNACFYTKRLTSFFVLLALMIARQAGIFSSKISNSRAR